MTFADKTAELWYEIDQLHLSYLQHDENPKKLELRKRLEKQAKEYLCIVSQDRKFVSLTTGDIIVSSARWIPEFSLTKAAQAFRYIEQYAANLINQPWRQEYRCIRQYNGYYMHNVKNSLIGAEKLFFDMGYTRAAADQEILELDLPPNEDITKKIDAVTKVARDCLLACVECTILQEIQTGVVSQFPITMDELLEFRRDYAGTPDDAIREIIYRKNQQMYQYPAFNPRMSQLYAPYSVGLPGFPGYAGGGGLPPLASCYPLPPVYSPGGPPPALLSPAVGGINSHPLHIPTQVAVSGMNGFYPGTVNARQQQRHQSSQGMGGGTLSSVPTGRLLDLEHSPAGSSTSTLRQATHIPTTILELTGGEEKTSLGDGYGGGARPRDSWADVLSREPPLGDNRHPPEGAANSSRRKEHGKSSGEQHAHRNSSSMGGTAPATTTNGGALETWEFVYNRLDSLGYNKDQAERPDVLIDGRMSRGNTETPSSSRMYNLTSGEQSEEEEMRRNISRMQSRNELEERKWQREEKEAVARHRTSREITSESEQENSKYSSAQSKHSSNTERDYRQALMERPQRINRTRSGHESSEKWSCAACTYLNPGNTHICEMCFKTRAVAIVDSGQEQMPPSGHSGGNSPYHGREAIVEKESLGLVCSHCTLVNAPGASVCDACCLTLGAQPIIPARKRV